MSLANATPRTVRANRLREQLGEKRNAGDRDALLDQLITFVTSPDDPLETEEDGE